MKPHFKIISAVAIALVILLGVILSCIEIICGLDIFRISDLANFIGWEHIEHVTIEDNHIDIILKSTVVPKEITHTGYSTEDGLIHINKLSSYIENNERYKDMKIRIQYNYAEDIRPIFVVANYSLSRRSEKHYDGLHSVRFYFCGDYDFEILTAESCKDIREVYLVNSYYPENVEAIQHLKNLEYLCFEDDETDSYKIRLRNEMQKYAPLCHIELSTENN
ncbi:MAG: hypothetical protein E7490_08725 [Ruminococcaceae bacterium]|nr:hypothetical protein [Oscillospiraceae bacterium]